MARLSLLRVRTKGTETIFPVFVLMIPLVSPAALHKHKLHRTLRDYTEYNHLIKKKNKTILAYLPDFSHPTLPKHTQRRSVR